MDSGLIATIPCHLGPSLGKTERTKTESFPQSSPNEALSSIAMLSFNEAEP